MRPLIAGASGASWHRYPPSGLPLPLTVPATLAPEPTGTFTDCYCRRQRTVTVRWYGEWESRARWLAYRKKTGPDNADPSQVFDRMDAESFGDATRKAKMLLASRGDAVGAVTISHVPHAGIGRGLGLKTTEGRYSAKDESWMTPLRSRSGALTDVRPIDRGPRPANRCRRSTREKQYGTCRDQLGTGRHSSRSPHDCRWLIGAQALTPVPQPCAHHF